MKMRDRYTCPLELTHDKLIHYAFADKIKYEGYSLQIEYRLTERGRKIFQSVTAIQDVGIEMMIEAHKKLYNRDDMYRFRISRWPF